MEKVFYHLRFLFVCTLSRYICCSEVDVGNTLVWGPGLKTEAVLPARYFFIHAVDNSRNNITHSLGEKAFAINIYQKDGSRARVWSQIMDRNDGSYVVRFRLYSTVVDLMIDVLHEGRHVAGSPYILKGNAYQEKCNCPEPNLDKWLKDLECPKSYRQIKLDLSLFKKVDMEVVEKEAVKRFNQRGRHSLCHYVVKDNKIYRKTYGDIVDFKMFMDRILLSMARKIYRKTYGQHVDFKMFMDAILLSVTRKMVLPDIEFFVNLGDWPLETRKSNENPLPIFSWCGSEKTRDIVMPTYDITESTLETMGRVSLDMISVQGNTGPQWENKSDTAFWRGRDSRQERLDMVKLSRKNPDIIDAALTNMFFFKHEEDLGEIVKHVSFFDFFKYKYQINVDGTVAAYRLPYLLAGDSLVLKQDSQYYEHFYKQLKPYEHYVPIKADLGNLMKQLQWAKDHQDEAKKIALNAQQFARDNLLGKDIFCYHAVLFKEYAKRLVNDPYVRKDMEELTQPDEIEAQCDCHHMKTKNKQKEKVEL